LSFYGLHETVLWFIGSWCLFFSFSIFSFGTFDNMTSLATLYPGSGASCSVEIHLLLFVNPLTTFTYYVMVFLFAAPYTALTFCLLFSLDPCSSSNLSLVTLCLLITLSSSSLIQYSSLSFTIALMMSTILKPVSTYSTVLCFAICWIQSVSRFTVYLVLLHGVSHVHMVSNLSLYTLFLNLLNWFNNHTCLTPHCVTWLLDLYLY